MRTNPRRGRRAARSARNARWLAVPVGLVASSLLVWQASNAAFSGTTDNPGNSWNAGTVALSDDDGGATALFDVANLKPGSTGEKCITVTYSGTLDALVKLYAPSASGTLAQHLNLTVERGDGGSFGNCSGFVADGSPQYTGTLLGFATAHTDFGNGWEAWTTATDPDKAKTYRFTYTLQNGTPDSEQGATASATFKWEAQNS
jgi:Camelysin metallo-endopeptidase